MLPSGPHVTFTSWAGGICQSIPGHQGPAGNIPWPSGRPRKLFLPTRWATPNSRPLPDGHAPAKSDGCPTPRGPQLGRRGFPRRAGPWQHLAPQPLQPLSPSQPARSAADAAAPSCRPRAPLSPSTPGEAAAARRPRRPNPRLPAALQTLRRRTPPAEEAALPRSRERTPGGTSFLSAVFLSPPPG